MQANSPRILVSETRCTHPGIACKCARRVSGSRRNGPLCEPQRMQRFGLLLLLLLFTSSAPCAREAAFPRPEYVLRSLDPGKDFRERSVNVMLKSRDGYLWIGSSHGLIRTDGVTFTNFGTENEGEVSPHVVEGNSLWEDTRGAIWAGTYDGVIQYDHGRLRRIMSPSGLPFARILRIDGNDAGETWIFTKSGVARARHGSLEWVNPYAEGGNIMPSIRPDPGVTPDFDKMGLWRLTSTGIERFAHGRWASFPVPRTSIPIFHHDIKNIYEDSLRRVWYALQSQPGRYFCVEADGGLKTFDGLPRDSFVSFQDREGYLWLSDHHGNAARWKNGVRYPLTPFRSPYLLNVIEQQDGSLWLGTQRTALFHVVPKLIRTVRTLGSPEFATLLLKQHDGTVWAGSNGLQRLYKDGLTDVPLRLPSGPLRPAQILTGLAEDPHGNLLFKISSDSQWRMLRPRDDHMLAVPSPLQSTKVKLAFLDRANRQWIATDDSLSILSTDGEPASLHQILSAKVNCMSDAAPGPIWVGTAAGPVLLDGEQLVPMPASARWTFGSAESIAADRNGDTWIGTAANGLVLYRGGRFYPFGLADGLPTASIGTVETGDPLDLWLKTDIGLLRVSRDSLSRRMLNGRQELQIRRFDESDGIPSMSLERFGNQGSLSLTDGTLWFSTLGGIAAIRPSAIPHDYTVPRTVIEEHTIDQSGLLATSPVVLQPGQSNLELHYTELGLSDPTTAKFRFRLSGIDPGWVNAGSRRVAYYSRMPPGTYHFQVQAASEEGAAWDKAGASETVIVLAPWYRKIWVRVLMLLLVAGTVVLALLRKQHRNTEALRVRQAYTQKLIESQESERKRIAHDLHDSLGQHLALILNFAHLGLEREGASRTIDWLDTLKQEAQTAIEEVEAISYNLRPYQLDRLGLTKAVLSLVTALEQAGSVELVSDIEDIDGFFPKELEINFYRIVQESLSNIARHSGAGFAEVRISRNPGHVRMVVRDNGRGFSDPPLSSRESLGLIGIVERAEALGGKAIIESAEQVGTTITVSIKGGAKTTS